MVKLSIILITARDDYNVMIQLPNTHILEPCIESLKNQTFKDFELIVVDALYDFRSLMFKGKPFQVENLSFPVKHVPLHPNHRFWLKRHRTCSSAAMNTGVIYAEGEHLVKIDDCCEFQKDYLERIWETYLNDYFALSIYTKYRGGKQAYYTKDYRHDKRKSVTGKQLSVKEQNHGIKMYGNGGPVRDSRWTVVQKRGKMRAPSKWFYGYSSFSLESALRLNGFDELFDGDPILVDVDMGIRLGMAGYNNLVLDKNIWVIEHEHHPISSRIISPIGNIKCNYAIMVLNERKRLWRANSYKLTVKDLDFIREESLRPPCQWHPHEYLDDCRGSLFKLWSENANIFDLREERLNV